MAARRPRRFEIRDHVRDAEYDPPRVQAAYDEMNLVAALAGDVAFSRLLRTRIGRVDGRALSAAIGRAARLGLLADAKRARSAARVVRREAASMTLTDLFGLDGEESPERLFRALRDLARAGVPVPVPATPRAAARRRAAAEQLVRDAGRWTYVRLFTTPRSKVTKAQLAAIVEAVNAGVVSVATNEKCCWRGKEECWYYTDKKCYITPGGVCSTTSDPCPGT